MEAKTVKIMIEAVNDCALAVFGRTEAMKIYKEPFTEAQIAELTEVYSLLDKACDILTNYEELIDLLPEDGSNSF